LSGQTSHLDNGLSGIIFAAYVCDSNKAAVSVHDGIH